MRMTRLLMLLVLAITILLPSNVFADGSHTNGTIEPNADHRHFYRVVVETIYYDTFISDCPTYDWCSIKGDKHDLLYECDECRDMYWGSFTTNTYHTNHRPN